MILRLTEAREGISADLQTSRRNFNFKFEVIMVHSVHTALSSQAPSILAVLRSKPTTIPRTI